MSEQFQTPSELDSSAVSWPAIAAGAISIAALTLVLLTIGSALGFSSVSPWSNSGISARTFQIGTGLYLVVTTLLSSTIGGYLSGRLRTKWKGVHSYEVQFRDTAHGFLAWALAAILGAAVLGGAATYLVGGVATGAAQGAAAGATQGAAANSDYYVAKLMRPSGNSAASAANAAPAAPADNSGTVAAPATGTTAATAAVGRNGPNPNQQARVIWAHGLAGDLSQSDRAYLFQLVAAQSGMS